jgi:putative ABC transport system substrate-binding protein
VIEREIESLLAQDVDMLFTAGSAITLKARRAVSGKAIPVVFAAVASPVERGVVDSIPQPGGDLTGVQVGLEIPKALQWLVTIVPGAKKVYVPYNPDEEVSTITLAALDKAAAQLGIQIIGGQVHSVEEAVVAIESLPEDVGAVFRIPSPTLDSRNDELSRAAIRRRLPMGAGLPLDEAVLFTFAADMFAAGKQAARLAGRIREGVDPADLPVESAEIFLAINLKTAEAIGLDIQDTILLQADTIIR